MAAYTLHTQSDTEVVVHQAETPTMCGDRYTLTADGVIRNCKGHKLSINARVVRGAVYAVASRAKFKFVHQSGAY